MLQYRDISDPEAIRRIRESGELLGDSREPWAYYKHTGNLYRVYNDNECREIGDFEEYCAERRRKDLTLPWWAPQWRRKYYPDSYRPC